MAGEPLSHLGVFVRRVVVEGDMDHLAGRCFDFNGIEKADEFLVPMTLRAAPDHRAIEHVEGGEQRGGAIARVAVGERAQAS